MRKIFLLVAIAVVMAALSTPSFAQSSKAAWRFEELIGLGTAATTASGEPVTDTGWIDILTTNIKTPNGKELAIGASLQCGLVTDTTVRSKNGELDSAAARGKIAVRIKITQPDGSEVFAQPSNGGDLTVDEPELALNNEGVTYCDRYQKLAARFSGLNCTIGGDGYLTCADPEELQLILKTLNANHFNFLFANALPGVQKVQVQARAQAGVQLGGTTLGAAGAEAFVGAGALSVETIRLVKDADGTTDLTGLQ